jgi:hypothetical protein
VPRSHRDGISANARCLDPGTVEGMSVSHIDGRPMLLGGIEIWISVSERKLNPVAS